MRISIARDFHDAPAGRYLSDGPYSGELFRNKHLVPALRAGEVVVVLDETEGYGSSFLEEAFGGLVRKEGFANDELRAKLKLVSQEDPSLIDEIWSYIDDAQQRAAH
ncbi:MAG: STAS-like domain-containing protein [Ferrovibrio sp.]|uniref:STAS-like domain-containing protein n=1 Tax=Ferrovibrio sp. TaxID=1917215 RepID=UPI003919CC79